MSKNSEHLYRRLKYIMIMNYMYKIVKMNVTMIIAIKIE